MHAAVGAPVFLLLFFLTLRGITTSSWSKSSELIALNRCEAGWLPLPSPGAAWGPEPLSVGLSELLLLLGSLATEQPLSLVSETVAPEGFSTRCTWACSAHPVVSSLSRAEKEERGFISGCPGESCQALAQVCWPRHQPANFREPSKTKKIAQEIPTNGFCSLGNPRIKISKIIPYSCVITQ